MRSLMSFLEKSDFRRTRRLCLRGQLRVLYVSKIKKTNMLFMSDGLFFLV